MGELPVQFTSLGIEGTWLNYSVAAPAHGHYLGIISARKDVVRALEVGIGKCFFDHFDSARAQEPERPLPSNASQKGSICDGCKHDATLCHEDVGGSQFRNVA